jgi:putative addiction module component (TIGR02574 family)
MLQALGGVLRLMAHLLYGVIGTGKELAVATAVEETGGMHSTEFDFTKLSIAERIQLAEDLWESILPEGADLPLTEAQKAELDRRLEELEHDPDAGESWEVVRARLYDRLKRGE